MLGARGRGVFQMAKGRAFRRGQGARFVHGEGTTDRCVCLAHARILLPKILWRTSCAAGYLYVSWNVLSKKKLKNVLACWAPCCAVSTLHFLCIFDLPRSRNTYSAFSKSLNRCASVWWRKVPWIICACGSRHRSHAWCQAEPVTSTSPQPAQIGDGRARICTYICEEYARARIRNTYARWARFVRERSMPPADNVGGRRVWPTRAPQRRNTPAGGEMAARAAAGDLRMPSITQRDTTCPTSTCTSCPPRDRP